MHLGRPTRKTQQHIICGAVALDQCEADEFANGKLTSLRVLVAQRASQSVTDKIFFFNADLFVKVQFAELHLFHHRHRDRQLIDALHGEMLTTIERRRFACLKYDRRHADLSFRFLYDLCDLSFEFGVGL